MAKQKNARRALAGAYRRISILLFGNTIRLQINLLYELYVLLLAAARIFGIGGRISVTEEGRKAAAAVRRDGFTKLLSVLPDGDMKAISDKIDRLFSLKTRRSRHWRTAVCCG